jgi:glucose-6-phosphate 1-epimerase
LQRPQVAEPLVAENNAMPNATPIESVQLVQLGELPALRIHNKHAHALIALQGAQLLEFTPHGAQPVIWLSEQAEFRRGQSIRGGIPVCWPWFGDLARNPAAVRAGVRQTDAPAHGLVRAQDWLLESVAERPEHTRIVLRHPCASIPDWSHTAELTLTITIGATLRLQLQTRNTGATPLTLSQALHTYFAVSAVEQVEIRGLDGVPYIDTLEDWQQFQQRGAVRANGEVDRIYRQVPAHVQLYDAGWQRTLHLRMRNSASAVVWNPHIAKARRLSQFAPDAWQRMLCIETANVLDDSVTLAADAEQTLEVEIESEA